MPSSDSGVLRIADFESCESSVSVPQGRVAVIQRSYPMAATLTLQRIIIYAMMIIMTPTNRLHSTNARWIALAVVCLGQLMSIMDGTIVTVALPAIQRDLQFTQSRLSWVLNGYFITFGSFLLLGGRLGDLSGAGGSFSPA